MPTFLSPGVFPREIELAPVNSNMGALRPVFVGTATKGPLNDPTLCTSPQQAVDRFGPPIPTSYMMYEVLGFMEEGTDCYIVRVGVLYDEGQDPALDDICIDMTGNRAYGWGRLPLFTGIDYGKITLRATSADAPLVFHDASVSTPEYNDQDISATDGATTATLNFAGTDCSDSYTGCLDDSFIVWITTDPDAGEAITGASYQVIRNSDNTIVAEGELTDNGSGYSQTIDIGDGIAFQVNVTAGRLEANDTFAFSAVPYNRDFEIAIEGVSAGVVTIAAGTYNSADAFATAFNAAAPGADYLAVAAEDVDGNEFPQIRTRDAGYWIQLLGTCGFAAEVGTQMYAYDIPRSHILGVQAGPYSISSQNNRVSIDCIPETGTKKNISFSLSGGLALSAGDVSGLIDVAGTTGGINYFDSFALTVPGGIPYIVILTSLDRMTDQLKMLASFSNLKTLRFAEQIGVQYPYGTPYRGFNDFRRVLPDTGLNDPATPLSCETEPASDECALDSAYFQNIVGWLVASSPGTWIDDYTVSVELQTQTVTGAVGRYQLTVRQDGKVIDVIQNLSFDKSDARYIGTVLNPGTLLGGVNGNEYFTWEERPTFLNNDPDADDYEVRQPAQRYSARLRGAADGIPTDPAFSNELDAAVIGNPADSTGIYSIQNAETYDATLLITPGFTSGAVIGHALQLCENRGDMVYLVDPPFGLRPDQVVDWHNGMLLSDLGQAIDSSYGALYWSWMLIEDTFNRDRIWVPPSGYVAGVYARTARVAETWYAPAGPRRGRIITPLKLEYNPSEGERDLLQGSGNAVNPLVEFPQQGITVFGERTLRRDDGVLSRVGNRLGVIYIRKNSVRMLRNYLWEPHDSITWNQVKNQLDSFLSDLQARRCLDGYKVVVDDSNNTPERRQRRQMWVSMILKFVDTIEFIVLNQVLLQATGSFVSEETLAAAGIVTRSGAGE